MSHKFSISARQQLIAHLIELALIWAVKYIVRQDSSMFASGAIALTQYKINAHF
ncbi:hypothetical protein QUB21_23155 [Microcoleus sp. AT9b-C4]|uniref:hypothetical protein n=1 Tax=unclassified Microcoleus TaxID=2642155 RepID=UPI002FD02768